MKDRKGITLIELIMVIMIVGILTTVSSMYIKETIDLWRFLSFRSELVSVGRMALARMTREIRQVVDNNSISAAELSRLRFTAIDLDGDGNDDTVEFYRNASSELRRIFNDSPALGDILASNVTSLTFSYYDSANSQLAVPVADTTQIYRIAIGLNIQSGDETKALSAQVFPRNF